MSKFRYLGLCAASMLALAVADAKPSIAAPTGYTLTKTVPLGGGIRWDYLHFDPASDRLFISHGTELTVLNGQTGAVIGHVRGLHGSHGIAIDNATGLGYADSSGTQTTTIFNLKTLRTVKTIPALKDADGMAIDPASNQVFVAAGDSNAVMPIDLKTNESEKPIALGGAPEFLVADGVGSLYINLNDKNEIAKIDTRTDTVVAHWPLTSCDRPTGLAIDTATHRLFASCQNSTMAVVNADTGAQVATLPIGRGTDAAAFDPTTKLAFSSNRDGTLSIIREDDADHFTVLPSVKTEPGARTIAVDPATGRIFLVTATVTSIGAPKHEGGPQSYAFKPGTFRAIILDPAS